MSAINSNGLFEGIEAPYQLRFARYFGTSERFWMNLQSRDELELEKDKLGRKLIDEIQSITRAA